MRTVRTGWWWVVGALLAGGCGTTPDRSPALQSVVDEAVREIAVGQPVRPCCAQEGEEAVMAVQKEKGTGIEVRKPKAGELDELGVKSWGTWGCGVSTFDWHYDSQETCYILEGEVTVEAKGQSVSFGPGDLVVFPVGLDCVWKVKKPVRKHYKFE